MKNPSKAKAAGSTPPNTEDQVEAGQTFALSRRDHVERLVCRKPTVRPSKPLVKTWKFSMSRFGLVVAG